MIYLSATSYNVRVNIASDNSVISFGDRPDKTLQRPYGNYTVIMQSLCNLQDLRTEIAQCHRLYMLKCNNFWHFNIISKINTTPERLKAKNFFICRYFSFYEQLNFRAQLS